MVNNKKSVTSIFFNFFAGLISFLIFLIITLSLFIFIGIFLILIHIRNFLIKIRKRKNVQRLL